jgi:hypothetical protein
LGCGRQPALCLSKGARIKLRHYRAETRFAAASANPYGRRIAETETTVFKRSLAVSAAFVAGSMCGPTPAPANDSRPSISVSGYAHVMGAPDLAIVGFAVETAAADASAAMEQNARKSQAVAAALKGTLGDADRMSTTGFSLDPVYDQRRDRAPDEPPAITGYIARNQVNVETKNTQAVGKLIDVAAKAGANRISGLQFTLEARDEAMSQALAEATADAQRQARAIAAALGVKLGPVLRASTSEPATVSPRQYRGMAMAMDSHAPTPVEAGDVRVDATVHVTFAID